MGSVWICSGSGDFVLVDWVVELSSIVVVEDSTGDFSGSDDLVLVVCDVELATVGVTVL